MFIFWSISMPQDKKLTLYILPTTRAEISEQVLRFRVLLTPCFFLFSPALILLEIFIFYL